MPIGRPSKSPRERQHAVLVAAYSGRALAAAARRARARVIVIDAFADLDTEELAESCIRVPRTARGFEEAALLGAVAALSDRAAGLVYGAGFEHNPQLLAKLAAQVPLLGNPPEVVAALKDPLGFAALLQHLGLPHPETVLAPRRGPGWLMKRRGGAGGEHIEIAGTSAPEPGSYYQRRVRGRPVSALFLADGQSASIIGFTEQWSDPIAAAPFRFGGCAGPLRLKRPLAAALTRACKELAAACGLVGLNSLDLMVDGEDFHVLEVNPRPGATLDVFDGAGGLRLWALHRRAVAGRLPPPPRPIPSARAIAILYAPARLAVPDGFAWPVWSADRTRPGTVVECGAPISTVRAAAPSVPLARARAAARAGALMAQLAAGRNP